MIVTSLAIGIGCGGGSSKSPMPDAPDIGFDHPKAVLQANMETGTDAYTPLGSADLSCLGTPGSDVASTVPITVDAVVTDFQTGSANPGIAVTAFAGIAIGSAFGSAVVSDGSGNVAIGVPAGNTRVGFLMHDPNPNDPSSIAPFDTYLLNQYFAPGSAVQTLPEDMGDMQSVAKSTGEELPAFVGVTRTAGTGVVAGAVRDCQDNEISNFVVTLSSTSGTATPIAGPLAFYFSAGVGVPAHHDQEDAASADGLFMIIQIPATTTTAYVQAWGYLSDADLAADKLTLVSELEVPVVADSVITGSFEPLRTQ
jgi:hypothetical protein